MSKTFTSKNLAYSGIFLALLCVSGVFSIQLTTINLSLQIAIIFILSCLLEKKLAALTVIAYLILGLIGLPVFSKGGGFGYVFQPSFGFLLGFVIGAYVLSAIYSSPAIKSKPLAYIIGIISSLFIVYILGSVYMYLLLNLYMGVEYTAAKTLSVAVIPFIPFDIAKAVLSYFIIIALEKATGKSQRPL